MNDCSCVYVDGYDSPELYNSKIRKAKKRHRCCECGRVIKIEEKYEVVEAKYSDVFETFKTCEDCLTVRASFFCSGAVHCCMWEDLREHLQAIDGEISSDCLIPLTKRARDRVCDMIEKVWERVTLWQLREER